jgi:hypothetical protein
MNEAQFYELIQKSLKDPIFGNRNSASSAEVKINGFTENPTKTEDTAPKGGK